ncbi:MAG: hypothetical protein K2I42_00990 [Anaeroplasmataceae bacterium]|nr:hypothetical protein [Anaeroplasmataceae bacterium]
MINNPTKSFSPLNKIHIGEYILETNSQGQTYLKKVASKKEYDIYLDQLQYSKHLKKTIFEQNNNKEIILFFPYEDKTEATVQNQKIINILKEIHEKSSYEITLKKEHFSNLNNLYKILDNKFSYFEMRIREIELSPYKNDVSWILLSKYNAILDAKLYLYDLQTDIFKSIDKNQIVQYGLIPKTIHKNYYNRQGLLPCFRLYYGPKSMLYTRIYLSLDKVELIEEIKKLDAFNQKYFCFMVLYILILSLNLDIISSNHSISNYLLITNKIRSFIHTYKQYF